MVQLRKKVKSIINYEKVDQIRLYSGTTYETVSEALAGSVCCVTGLSHTRVGEGLGMECDSFSPVLEPVLTYQIQLPEDCDVHNIFMKLKQLE